VLNTETNFAVATALPSRQNNISDTSEGIRLHVWSQALQSSCSSLFQGHLHGSSDKQSLPSKAVVTLYRSRLPTVQSKELPRGTGKISRGEE